MTRGWQLSLRAKRTGADGSSFQLDFEGTTEASRVVIMGASGSGKSSLLAAVLGLIPSRGKIALRDFVFQDTDGQPRPVHKRKIGWVDQDARLFPHFDVLENIRFSEPDRDENNALYWLNQVGGNGWQHRRADELSGGQRQRVALARAFASKPRALLLDEPFASLDPAARAELWPLLDRLAREQNLPWLWVTHDEAEALAAGEEIWQIDDGSRFDATTAVGLQRNVFRATVCEHLPADGTTRLEVDGQSLFATTVNEAAGRYLVFELPAEAIVVLRDPPPVTSARNSLKGNITRLTPGERTVDVVVETPLPLHIRLTEASRRELQLEVGTEVHLLFKASALRRRY
jgi:molybdate transport system ATP-binding protein